MYAQIPPYIPQNGLVGWWPFNATAVDESAGTNDGTVNGATLTTDRFGLVGSAYEFDGVNDNLTFPNAINFGTNSFTVSMYCYVRDWGATQADGYSYIYGTPLSGGTNDQGFRFSCTPNKPVVGGSGFQVAIGDASTNDYYLYSQQPVYLNRWYYLAMVYDRNARTFTMYVDGAAVQTVAVSANFGNTDLGKPPTAGSFKLDNWMQHYFNGKIDDVAVWDRALTAQEVAVTYNACGFNIVTEPSNQSVNSGAYTSLSVVTTESNAVNYKWQKKVNNQFVDLNDPSLFTNAWTSTVTINSVNEQTSGTYRCMMTLNECTIYSSEVSVSMYTGSTPASIPQNGLLGWWPFNGNANDSSGNNRHFTVYGASLTSDRNGSSNNAYSFDGVNDYMQVNINQTAAFTLSAWIYNGSASRVQGTMQYKYPCIRGGGTAIVTSYGKLGASTIACGECSVQTCNNWSGDRFDLADIGSGSWRHVVLVVDGVDKIKLYRDGVLVNTFTQASLMTTYPNLPLILGKVNDENTFYFDGKIDDVGLWSRALTDSEISALYSSCSVSVTSQPSGATVKDGQQVTLSVGVSNSSGAMYQWQRKDGASWVNIAGDARYFGANTSKLTIESAQSTKAGPYRCVVTAGSCTLTSNEAALTVNCNCGSN
jgi:hypothetical protein